MCDTSARLFEPQLGLYQLKIKYFPLIFQHVQNWIKVRP